MRFRGGGELETRGLDPAGGVLRPHLKHQTGFLNCVGTVGWWVSQGSLPGGGELWFGVLKERGRPAIPVSMKPPFLHPNPCPAWQAKKSLTTSKAI